MVFAGSEFLGCWALSETFRSSCASLLPRLSLNSAVKVSSRAREYPEWSEGLWRLAEDLLECVTNVRRVGEPEVGSCCLRRVSLLNQLARLMTSYT